MLLYHANSGVAVVSPYVLNELSSISDQHPLQSVNEWATPLVETI